MSKLEEIRLMLEESKAKTSALQEEYERLVIEEKKKKYQMNSVEPTYKLNWEGYARDLERELLCLSHEDMSGRIEHAILKAQKNNSVKIPVDNKKVYTCPVCGRSNTLYIGEYGFDKFDSEYAVTCSQCDFVGPSISDYGEAWVVFKQWLRDENYI